MNRENTDDIDGMMARLRVVSDQEAERLRTPTVEAPSAPALRKIYRDAGFPERHATLDTQETTGPWANTRDGLAGRIGSGFLCALIGGRGVGKTQMAMDLSSTVIRAGGTARFTTATKFLMEIKETYRKDAPKTEREVVVDYGKPKLLIIDEIGRRGETDWEDRLLFELLNDRYNAVRDTIVISNHPTEAEFSKAVGDSLVSRINETGGVIACNWTSFRK